ncbi:GAP family protein [Microbacterium sp.]|uniref:GAP family protein n=1 Tax=Microbacterium sp. TaxID=51671 RepID=UPI0039E3FCB0
MDILHTLPLPAALALLALVDGLSVGTLLIPLFLLIAPGRPRVPRIMLYLVTITVFYFAVGVLFTLGIVNVIDLGREFLASTAGRFAMLAGGLVMLALGIWIGVLDARRRKRAAAGDPTALEGRGRLLRWRERLLAPGTGRAAVMGVPLAAGLAEVAGMLPYLIGMTMLADAPIGMPGRFAMLAGYCMVMILPALLLLGLRVAAAGSVERPLRRFTGWMQRTGAENTSWVFGIVGLLLARSAFTQLGIVLPVVG